MSVTNTRKLNCPTCGNPVQWTDEFPYRPFCCKRCQLIDFGDWAAEKHSIPGETVLSPKHSESDL